MQAHQSSEKSTRMTRQRAVILSELRKVTTHPTAEQIYATVKEILPRISLGTVYRNLDFLVETGEVRLLDSASNVRRFDGDISPHTHARCKICGNITDIFNSPHNNVDLKKLEINNFTITEAEINYVGICHDCSLSNVAHRQ